MSEPSLQLLHDADLNRALEGVEVRAFRYTRNTPGQRVVGGLALICLVGCVISWFVTQWIDPFSMALGVLLGSFGGALFWYVWHWHVFAERNFVAISDEHLYVGWAAHKGRAWRIGWDLLDIESLGLRRMRTTRLSASLPIRVVGQEIELHLFGPLAYLTHYQELMGVLLKRVAADEMGEALEEAFGDEEEVLFVEEEHEVTAGK